MADVGLYAQAACIWEATARKPGNVTRFRDFEDVTYLDFLLSAAAITPAMATACQRKVGTTVLEAVRATRQVVRTNTNLGIILLLAPLAAVPEGEDLRSGVERILADLDIEDARLVYEAIRLAAPGGLGRVQEQDVREEPTRTLREAMTSAAGRDLVARQYADGFAEVFDDGVPALIAELGRTGSVEGAIIGAHLRLMAKHPDTLIARKRGMVEAEEAARRARRVLERGWPWEQAGQKEIDEFDEWLRVGECRRNPGTTADLLTASLFVALRQAALSVLPDQPWPAHFGRFQG